MTLPLPKVLRDRLQGRKKKETEEDIPAIEEPATVTPDTAAEETSTSKKALPTVVLEDAIDTVEDTAEAVEVRVKKSFMNYVQDFVDEAGKYSLLLTIFILGSLFAPEAVQQPKLLGWFLAISIAIMGNALLFVWFYGRKQSEEARTEAQKEAKTWQDDFTTFAHKSKGWVEIVNQDAALVEKRHLARIEALERLTESAIIEVSVPDGRPLHMNVTFQRLFGYSLLELQDLFEVSGIEGLMVRMLRPEDFDKLKDNYRKRLDGTSQEPATYDMWISNANNETIPVRLSVAWIKENGTSVLQYHFMDIRKEQEQQHIIWAQDQMIKHVLEQAIPDIQERDAMEQFYKEILGDTKHEYARWPP